MKKFTFIGDVHSAADDLEALLTDSVIKNTQLIFLGDYIDGMSTRYFSNTKENMLIEPLKVLDIIKQRVEQYGDIALKGNHDDFWIKTSLGDEYSAKLWAINGGKQTWRKLGIHSSNPNAVSLALNSGDLKQYTEFLASLPLIWQNSDILAVRAGIYWDNNLNEQSDDDLMWIRDDYYFNDVKNPTGWHKNLLNKVIVTGHTPVQTIQGMGIGYIKMQADSEDVPRYLIDSGSRSGAYDGGIFALTLDEVGNEVQMKKAIKGKLYDGNERIEEAMIQD